MKQLIRFVADKHKSVLGEHEKFTISTTVYGQHFSLTYVSQLGLPMHVMDLEWNFTDQLQA